MPVIYSYYDKEKMKKRWETHTDENENRHRTDGPACIWYREDDSKIGETYWINDVGLYKEYWEVHPLVIAALINKNVGV